MTTTPTIAVEPFIANTFAVFALPRVIRLSDGTGFVAWLSILNNNPGFAAFGQAFDSDGNKVGKVVPVTSGPRYETANFDIVALNHRQFATIGLEKGTVDGRIRPVSRRSEVLLTGIGIRTVQIKDAGAVSFVHNDFALAGVEGTWVSHEISNIRPLRSNIFQNNTSALRRTDVKNIGFGRVSDDVLESTALRNGTVVLLHDKDGDADARGDFEIQVLSGIFVGEEIARVRTGDSNKINFDGQVQGLNSSNFVVAWSEDDGNDTDVLFSMFRSNGTVLKPRTLVGNTGRDNNRFPAIAQLDDGGFIVFYVKMNTKEIRGQRYDLFGDKEGEDFLVVNDPQLANTNDGFALNAVLLDNNKVAVTYLALPSAAKVAIVEGTPEIIFGTDGDDRLVGGDGNDTIFGNRGDDDISGNAGNDKMDGGGGNDNIRGGEGRDSILGGNNEDTLLGNQGDDTLRGEGGDDVLIGGQGNDLLIDGPGNDTMNGNVGSDRFVISTNGANVINDFNVNDPTEIVDLTGVLGIDSFADLVANHMTQVGNDVLIDSQRATTILIRNVTIEELAVAENFIV